MPHIVRTETSRGFYVTLTLATLADEAGVEHQREVVGFGDSVCVLPYDPERRLALMVRLPRAPLLLAGETEPLVEAPAGMIDEGETPEAAARREAMEETGLVLTSLEPVGVCWTSPGVLAERSHLFLAPFAAADRQGEGGGLASEHEAIKVEEFALARLAELADVGGLQDLKTLLVVQTLRLRRPNLF